MELRAHRRSRHSGAKIQPNRWHAIALSIAVLLCGFGCAHVAPEASYCERLHEIRVMPFNSGDVVEDEVYNGLRSQGKEVVACLLEKVTDTQVMPDPRKAPPVGGFTVGDAAVSVLTDICDTSIEEALPLHVREEWSQQGVYAYFAFVHEGVENRRAIAEGLERQGCD